MDASVVDLMVHMTADSLAWRPTVTGPHHSGNMAYDIKAVRPRHQHSRLRVLEASFLLEKVQTYCRPLDGQALAIRTPHEYAEPPGWGWGGGVSFSVLRNSRTAAGRLWSAGAGCVEAFEELGGHCDRKRPARPTSGALRSRSGDCGRARCDAGPHRRVRRRVA